jgi:hypothetical protein
MGHPDLELLLEGCGASPTLATIEPSRSWGTRVLWWAEESGRLLPQTIPHPIAKCAKGWGTRFGGEWRKDFAGGEVRATILGSSD